MVSSQDKERFTGFPSSNEIVKFSRSAEREFDGTSTFTTSDSASLVVSLAGIY